MAKIVAVLLGLAVGVMIPLGVWLAHSAQEARNDARAAAADTTVPAPSMGAVHDHSELAEATPSFAGLGPEDADALATAHRPYPAALPALQPGPVARISLSIQHRTIQIAPGIR
jgi:hypothetical protein